MDIDSSPTTVEAAALMVAASAVDVRTDRGETIELWTISNDGDVVRASGPRLAVASGMRLECRLANEGAPLQIAAVIESAEYRSAARAALELRIETVATEARQRRAARVPLNVQATLRAEVCDRLPPGEAVPGVLADLSDSGVAVVITEDRVRAGDRMRLSARVVEGRIDCDVRVARIAATTSGGLMAGCSFIDAAQVAPLLGRVLSRLEGTGREAAGLEASSAVQAARALHDVGADGKEDPGQLGRLRLGIVVPR